MISDTSFFLNMAGNAGALAFVFWLSWRLTKYTIPSLLKSFERNLVEQRKDLREEASQARQDFMSALERTEKFFASQIEREREVHQEQMRNITDAVETLGAETEKSSYRQQV